jgi:ComF family protein
MFLKKICKLIFDSLLEIIYPPFCCHCGKFGNYLCPECFGLIKFYPLPLEIKVENPELDKLIAGAQYAEPLRSLIKKMKYGSAKDIGKVLGGMLWQTTHFPLVDLITAVPLHPSRKNKRGFNQAEIIARELSRLSQIPYREILIRTTNNKNQASIKDKEERLLNLENIFQLAPKYENKLKSNANQTLPQKILIIDDVTTTGATLNECAKVLKKHQVKKIIGLVIAHGS